MPVARRIVLSTASLVVVRALGVGARTLGLLTLAAGMPAERFAHYALAFVLSELARCAADFGLDPVILRRAEGLPLEEQRPMVRAALAIRATHGLAAAVIVLAILALALPFDVLIAAAGLQFLSQGFLQLGLNWRQVNNSAHRVVPSVIALYLTVIGLAAFAYFHPAAAHLPLPLLLAGELAISAVLLAELSFPGPADMRRGYEWLVPQALPMAGIAFLAFINTRTDALIVGRFVGAEETGKYLYLARWVDLVPMLVTGVALPLVGKVANVDLRRNLPLFVAVATILVTAPFALVEIATRLNPGYASDVGLRVLLSAVTVCRVGLATTTVMLLARWHDRLLARIAVATTMLLPLLTWTLGQRFGVHGVAAGVLIAEAGNFLFQTILLLGPRGRVRPASFGKHDD